MIMVQLPVGTRKALGVTVPDKLLATADRIYHFTGVTP
jgi:hypothetical protein